MLSTEFAALLKVMELSRAVPDRLAAFGLALVREVVLTGEGEAITGERHAPGRVTRADVDAEMQSMFRNLFAFALALSALALLAMTLVIQVFVYPGAWVTHGLWAACFLALIAKGPGAASLDRLIARRTRA